MLLGLRTHVVGPTQEKKQEAAEQIGAALRQLREIEEASKEGVVYFRGRSTVHTKPGTNFFSKLVS